MEDEDGEGKGTGTKRKNSEGQERKRPVNGNLVLRKTKMGRHPTPTMSKLEGQWSPSKEGREEGGE